MRECRGRGSFSNSSGMSAVVPADGEEHHAEEEHHEELEDVSGVDSDEEDDSCVAVFG